MYSAARNTKVIWTNCQLRYMMARLFRLLTKTFLSNELAVPGMQMQIWETVTGYILDISKEIHTT